MPRSCVCCIAGSCGVIGHDALLEGGGLPARRPSHELCLARQLEARTGPQHLWPAPNQHVLSYNSRPLAPMLSNLARNSPATPSNIEFASLELQRFPAVSKNYRLKLCAKFVWARPAIARRRRGQALPPPTGTSAWSGSRGLSGAFHARSSGGFAAGASPRRVAPLMMQFPPFGGGEAGFQTGVVPKVQTTSVKDAENGVLWARWSAFWAQLRRTWCVYPPRSCVAARCPSTRPR